VKVTWTVVERIELVAILLDYARDRDRMAEACHRRPDVRDPSPFRAAALRTRQFAYAIDAASEIEVKVAK